MYFEKNSADRFPAMESDRKMIKGYSVDGPALDSWENVPLDSSLKAVAEAETADCGLGGGGGICIVLDFTPEISTVKVLLDNCEFEGNHGSVGGNRSARCCGRKHFDN